MTFPESALDRLASSSDWQPDWSDVLARADEQSATGRHPITTRRLILALAVLAAIVIPLTALGAANDWWFLGFGAPTPTSAPVVVTTGTWTGHPWQLVAYPSTTDGLCFAITPPTSPQGIPKGGAMSCGPFVGVPRTAASKASPDMTITALSGSGSSDLPAYVAGPVVETASTVEIHLTDGQTLRTATFEAPAPLDHIRFYATQLPGGVATLPKPGQRWLSPLEWVAGLDANGTIVACLAPLTAKDGISQLSDCR